MKNIPEKIPLFVPTAGLGFGRTRFDRIEETINDLIDFLSTQEEEKVYKNGYIGEFKGYTTDNIPDYKGKLSINTPSPQEKGWERQFDRRFDVGGFNNILESASPAVLKDFIKKTLTTEREKVRGWAKENRKIDGEHIPHMWLLKSEEKFSVDDFNGVFESQRIIGYNTALANILKFLDHMEG